MILWGGTAVVVVAAVAGGLLLAERSRVDRLRAAPGGVIDLDTAPRADWHVDLEATVEARVVPVGDLAAVTAHGTVRAFDPADGSERWSVDVLDERQEQDQGGEVRCGPSSRTIGSVAVRAPEPSDPLVCVTVDLPTTEVVVIRPDGHVERREWDGPEDGEYRVLAPLADGGLAVLDHTDTELDLGDATVVENDEDAATITGTVASAPGLTVRVEDAVTGETRWTSTVDFDMSSDETACVMWSDDGPRINVTGDLSWSADSELITADACGIRARLATADGSVVEDARTGRQHLPWAMTDDALASEPALEVTDATDTLVRTSDTAVVLTTTGTVEAYDTASSDRLWTSDVLGEDAAAVVGSAVFGAYTDGHRVMLVLDGPSTGSEGQLRFVALDLDTGEIVWDEHQDEAYAQVAEVDGHLVQITAAGITGLTTTKP